MKATPSIGRFRALSSGSPLLLGILLLFGVASCGGGGGGGPDQGDGGNGYFTGTGTFNSTDYIDVTALAYGDRILLFSPTANVLYDITRSATLSDYTGTVEVFVAGVKQVGTPTVSGTNNGLRIQGTYSGGTGFGEGSFDVTFDAGNNKGATLATIAGVSTLAWAGDFYGIDLDSGTFDSELDGDYFGIDDTGERCLIGDPLITGFVIPDSNTNIYQMAHDITAVTGTCSNGNYASTGHTGFAAVVDGTRPDNKMVFAFENGSIALFGILNKP